MTVWAFVPGRTFEGYVNDLPATARRIDTGKVVEDVAKWSRACGYFDAESPTVVADITKARKLTPAESDALTAALDQDLDARTERIDYVQRSADEWTAQRQRLMTWFNTKPPSLTPPVNTVAWFNHLYAQEMRLTESMVLVTDLLHSIVATLLVELEQADTFHPPDVVAFVPPDPPAPELLPIMPPEDE